MRIIEALADETSGLTVTDLQATTGIDKSTVSRVLTTLETDGYIKRVPNTDLLRLSVKLVALGLRFIEKTETLDLCTPILREVADVTGELVQLALTEGGAPIYVAKAHGRSRIQTQPLIGTPAIPHASTAGKLWLASMSEFEAIATIQGQELRKMSPKTKTDPQEIIADIRVIRESGYALIEGELSEEVNAVAVPMLHPPSGRFLGALCLAVPAYRATGDVLRAYVPMLQKQAAVLAGLLNYCGLYRAAISTASSPSELQPLEV